MDRVAVMLLCEETIDPDELARSLGHVLSRRWR